MTKKTLAIAAAATVLVGSTSFGLAQSPAQERAPGQQMQDKGPAKDAPGASGYAPGQRMQDKGSRPGEPGASGYAPGRANQDNMGSGNKTPSGGTRR